MITPLIDRKNKIIMGWTPKAACTTAIKMFFDNMGILDRALKYHPWVHEFRELIFYSEFGEPSPEDFDNPEFFKFKIVRNPYHRSIGGFDIFLKEKHKAFDALSFSFEDFVKFLQTEDLNYCNPHWKYQSDEHNDKYKIVKVENLTEEIKKINKLTGSKFKTDLTSDHHHVKVPLHKFIGDRKFYKVFPPKIPAYEDFYNIKLKATIREIYAQDFEDYDYQQAIP